MHFKLYEGGVEEQKHAATIMNLSLLLKSNTHIEVMLNQNHIIIKVNTISYLVRLNVNR